MVGALAGSPMDADHATGPRTPPTVVSHPLLTVGPLGASAMPNGLRSVLAVVAGVIVGSVVNLILIRVGSAIFPHPEGVNPDSLESIRENIHRFPVALLLSTFAAHAIGTLVGAAVAARLSPSRGLVQAMIVGAWFLAAGIGMIILIPDTPRWFAALEIVAGYLPMAWIGWRLGTRPTG